MNKLLKDNKNREQRLLSIVVGTAFVGGVFFTELKYLVTGCLGIRIVVCGPSVHYTAFLFSCIAILIGVLILKKAIFWKN